MRGIEHLHPDMREKALELQSLCAKKGLPLLITETLRTTAEQDALYAQGRTKPGSIVTNCKGSTYQSPHQWGVAFDFCKNIKGAEYSDIGFFETIGALGKSIGLFWGGDFKSFTDRPHLELPEYLPSNSTATLKARFGTPDKFIATWTEKNSMPEIKEDEEMTQSDFNKMLDVYFAEQAKKSQSEWSEKEGCWDKAVKAGIFDGTAPQASLTREQAAAVLGRLGLVK